MAAESTVGAAARLGDPRHVASTGRAAGTRPGPGPDPAAGYWATRAGAVLWPLAVLALAQVALRSALGPARDLDILWNAGARLLSGAPLYDPERAFIFPPVAGWVLAALSALPFRGAVVVVTLVGVAALVLAVVLLLRLAGIGATSPATAATLLFLALSRPVGGLLWQGNVDVLLVLAEVVVIRCLVHRRDLLAGALLGVVCALKPTLAPLLLGTLMLGRTRTTAVAAVVGAVLTVLGLMTVPDGAVFVREILPMLADGNREVLHQYDKSLRGAAETLGLPDGVSVVLRAAVLVLAVAVAWRRRHGPLAPVEVLPLLLLGGLLASSFSWANYSLYLLPLLLGVVLRGSVVQWWPAWAAVFLLWTADEWPSLGPGETVEAVLRLRPTFGWLLLLVSAAWVALRGRQTTLAAVPTPAPTRPPPGHDEEHPAR